MKYFRRSLRYLWPYRVRLGFSVFCVLVISVLWSGGLGMLGPGARVLMDEDGLHGWAYSRMAGDCLEFSPVLLKLPPGREIEPGRSMAPVLSVRKVEAGGRAQQAGVAGGDRIIGIYDADASHRLMRGDDLLRTLALTKAGEKVVLRVMDPMAGQDRQAAVTLGQAKWTSRVLGRAVSMIRQPQNGVERFKVFLSLMLIVLVMTFMREVFRFMQEYLVETAIYRAIMDLRCQTYNVALRLPMTFYSEKGTTDTMSRFIQDTSTLAQSQVTLFGKTLAEPAKAVGALVMAFVFSWRLTLLALVAGPPTFLLIRKFGNRMRRASKRALEGWATILAVLEETLTGVRVVKTYTMEGAERRRFFRANRALFKQQKKIARIDAASAPTVEAMGITAAMGAAAIGGYWVFCGQMDMDLTDFLATMGCLAAIFDPVRKLAKVITRFQHGDAAAARIFEVQDRQQERSFATGPALRRHSRSIEFRNVSFRYPSASEDALKDVSLTVQAGTIVAVVGPNGSGKTTLVSLLPRLIDPHEGKVLIDGQDVSQYSMRSLRKQIAVVTQDTVLFHASIAENIAYGTRRAKDGDVLAAARQAFVDEFVRELPGGYDTMVGEHGATLSGGQRQRIAIARAILRDPAILIFDEATSQIDADSEQRIHQAMETFVRGRTTLMVAHRFATVSQAQIIVVMNAGRIVDVGEHSKLLQRCAIYRNLYETQLGQTIG